LFLKHLQIFVKGAVGRRYDVSGWSNRTSTEVKVVELQWNLQKDMGIILVSLQIINDHVTLNNCMQAKCMRWLVSYQIRWCDNYIRIYFISIQKLVPVLVMYIVHDKTLKLIAS